MAWPKYSSFKYLNPLGHEPLGQTYCRDLENYQQYAHVIAMASWTSNIPQNDLGKYLGLYMGL